jgi:thiol-disulfide isomerase/thioredoxin
MSERSKEGPPSALAPRERWRRLLIEVTLLLLLVGGVSLFQTRNHPRGPAPALPTQTLDGAPLAPAATGAPTLVVFWAPWCSVCKVEARNLGWAQSLVGERARVVTVAVEYESLDEVRQFVADHHVTVPVLLGGSSTAARWSIGAYPTAFVIDRSGQITTSVVGYTTTLGLVARLLL